MRLLFALRADLLRFLHRGLLRRRIFLRWRLVTRRFLYGCFVHLRVGPRIEVILVRIDVAYFRGLSQPFLERG